MRGGGAASAPPHPGVRGFADAGVTGITGWSLRHKRLVAGFWLVLTILGIAFSQKATDALSQEYSIPGLCRAKLAHGSELVARRNAWGGALALRPADLDPDLCLIPVVRRPRSPQSPREVVCMTRRGDAAWPGRQAAPRLALHLG
jgi:hypothetical protein